MFDNYVLQALNSHKSTRSFLNKPIPEKMVSAIIQAGTRAATGGNLQCYSFVAIDDLEVKKKLNQYDPFHNLSTIPLIIIVLADTHRLKQWFQVNKADYSQVNELVYFFLANWDALIALQNVCIAAESLGLGAFYNGNILEYDVYETLNAPEYTFPAGMLCLGYPATDKALSTRLPLEAIIHKNYYKELSDLQVQNFYKERSAIWEKLTPEKLAELAKQGIHNLPQAIAKQKFNANAAVKRSDKVFHNLMKSGFNFDRQTGNTPL